MQKTSADKKGAGMGNNIFVILLFFYGIIFLVSIGFYVLEALGLYWLAQYREHKSPWWAWVPIASWLLMGDLTDEFTLFKKKFTGRKIIYWFLAGYGVVFVAAVLFGICVALGVISQEPVLLVLILLFYLLLFAVLMSMMVLLYILCYNFYKTYKPENASLYLILSIFFSISIPIIIFSMGNEMRKKFYRGI